MNHEKPPLIILTGPTAVGKTALSVRLAKAVDGEIISADSMQVYRGMDIGTAKITKEEMQGIPHHLIDILDPKEPFDVVRFQSLAKTAIFDVLKRGKMPILTGGTGFYIQSVLYDIDFSEEEEEHEIRRRLEEQADAVGAEEMHRMLSEIDPVSAKAIPPGNVKRVIRALEYYQKNGRQISEHNAQQRMKDSAWNSFYFVLTDDRKILYERIDRRVEKMFENGLVDEVSRLRNEGCTKDMISMQGIGYRQVFDYLEGYASLKETMERIQKETRHFAKRQLTWFRREKDVIWLDKQKYQCEDAVLEEILERIHRNETEQNGSLL